jgi:hypothetical protein
MIAMENSNRVHDQGAPCPARTSKERNLLWQLSFLYVAIFVWTFLIVIIVWPFAALGVLWVEYRLRRSYRRVNRLLKWNQVKEKLSQGEGSLLVEVFLKPTGHVWWLEKDLRSTDPNCPLPPASILQKSFGFKERFGLLHYPVSQTWWDVHVTRFNDEVFYVQMPFSVSRALEPILTAPGVYVVDVYWTGSFKKHPNKKTDPLAQ